MQANELAEIIFGKSDAQKNYVAAIERWNKVHSQFKDNLDQIEVGDMAGLESVSRIRLTLIRRATDFVAGKWLERAWAALPAGAKPAEKPEKPEQAKMVAEWAATASDKTLRKLGEEALIDADDTVSVEFFERAAMASLSVGLMSVMGEARGTGFFVGPGILVTNNHVVDSELMAGASMIVMNKEENRVGPAKLEQEYELDPKRFFFTHKELDFTLVATKKKSSRGLPVEEFGALRLIRGEGKILKGHNANIIQHMSGKEKVVAFRQSVLVELTNRGNLADFCYYTGDTAKGSSGSPVFNDLWQVIALHHHGLPKLDVNGQVLDRNGKQISKETAVEHPELIAWEANEGTRVSRLVAELEKADLNPAMTAIRTGLLEEWDG